MKNLQDIFPQSEETPLDIQNQISERHLDVSGDISSSFSDLHVSDGRQEIMLGKKRSIKISHPKNALKSDALSNENLSAYFKDFKYSLKIRQSQGISHARKALSYAQEKVSENLQKLQGKDVKVLPRRQIQLPSKKQRGTFKVSVKNLSDYPKIPLSKILVFVFCFSLLYAVSAKFIVESRVNSAFSQLLEIKQGNLSPDEMAQKINNARFNLMLADIVFSPFSVIPAEKTQSVDHLINAGRSLSRAGDKALFLYSQTRAFTDSKDLEEIYFSQLLLNIYPLIDEIHADINNSKSELERISWLPDPSLLEQKRDLVSKLNSASELLGELQNYYPEFMDILGHSERSKYLIVFQNADEIRPTGGFMGSMGYLELYKGQMKLFQKKDVYAIEWDLKSADYERLPAPKGLAELTENFGLRDANYFASIKTSSETIEFFTSQAGIELDGIVYLNQNIILEFLELLGPVYLADYNIDISADNFSEVMSLLVESKISKQGTLGTPKQVLFDFMEHFSRELFTQKRYIDYAKILLKEVQNRDLVFWSFDEKNNQALSEFGLNGDISYDASLDFIYPVYTSLSGNKSDRYMRRSYDIVVNRIENSCDYDVEVAVKNSHNMPESTKQRITTLAQDYEIEDIPYQLSIQGNARNRQFVRVLLPPASFVNLDPSYDIVNYGSRMGIELFHETQVQESSYYNFSYTLENAGCKAYDFTFYKQAGIPSYDLNLTLFGKSYNYTGLESDFYFQEK